MPRDAETFTTHSGDGTGFKLEPDNKLNVVDLTVTPPRIVATVEGGKQPSGLAISPRGDLVLVANRADNTGTTLKLADTMAMGEPVAAWRSRATVLARRDEVSRPQDRGAEDRGHEGDV